MVVPARVTDCRFQSRTAFLCAFDNVAETHQLETRVAQRDVARDRAGASLPAIRIIVAAPAANAVHTGARAGTRQVIAATTCPAALLM